MNQILSAFEEAKATQNQPTVIPQDRQGKGFAFADGKAAYHNAAMNEEEYAREEIGREMLGGLKMGMSNMRKGLWPELLELGAPTAGRSLEPIWKINMSSMFGDEFPARYFQWASRRQNMFSAAAGLALTGHVASPTFRGTFASSVPTIRSAPPWHSVPGRQDLRLFAGLSDYGDGKTHQTIDYITIMRYYPNMKVFLRRDAIETANS
jgi:transketolase